MLTPHAHVDVQARSHVCLTHSLAAHPNTNADGLDSTPHIACNACPIVDNQAHQPRCYGGSLGLGHVQGFGDSIITTLSQITQCPLLSALAVRWEKMLATPWYSCKTPMNKNRPDCDSDLPPAHASQVHAMNLMRPVNLAITSPILLSLCLTASVDLPAGFIWFSSGSILMSPLLQRSRTKWQWTAIGDFSLLRELFNCLRVSSLEVDEKPGLNSAWAVHAHVHACVNLVTCIPLYDVSAVLFARPCARYSAPVMGAATVCHKFEVQLMDLLWPQKARDCQCLCAYEDLCQNPSLSNQGNPQTLSLPGS
jgi:hypothetical protein